MKKMMTKLSIAFVAGALFCAAASAAPAIDWDQPASVSAAGENLQAGFQALGKQVASSQDRVIYGTPYHYQDVFADVPECSMVDAKFFRALTLDEAVQSLTPCLQVLSQRYSVPVSAEKGAVGVNGGLGLTAGIVIHLPAQLTSGNHILMDLSYSIREQRSGKLMGFPAMVVSGTYNVPLPEPAADGSAN